MGSPNKLNKVFIDNIREISSGSISGAYAPIGSALTFSPRLMIISNGMNAGLYISDDGINNKFRLPANSFKLLDFSSNELVFNNGTIFYAKQISSAPTAGDLWIELIGTLI